MKVFQLDEKDQRSIARLVTKYKKEDVLRHISLAYEAIADESAEFELHTGITEGTSLVEAEMTAVRLSELADDIEEIRNGTEPDLSPVIGQSQDGNSRFRDLPPEREAS